MLEPTPWDKQQLLLELERWMAFLEVQHVLNEAAKEERELHKPMDIILVGNHIRYRLPVPLPPLSLVLYSPSAPMINDFKTVDVDMETFMMWSGEDCYTWTLPSKDDAQKCLDAGVPLPYSAPIRVGM